MLALCGKLMTFYGTNRIYIRGYPRSRYCFTYLRNFQLQFHKFVIQLKMSGRSFNVYILFTICLFIGIDVAKTDTKVSTSSSSSSSSTGTSYSTDINNGELGLKFNFESSKTPPKMAVVIYYDTENQSATDFFKQQLTADVIQGFTDCNVIDWNFMPCGTSQLKNGQLSCPMGPTQCSFDVIHACVAKLYGADEVLFGKFIICFFANKDVNACVANSPGYDMNAINQCVNSNTGATECDAFFTKIHGPGVHQMLGGSTGSASTNGTSDFKGTLCEYLRNAGLVCNFCPATASTPSV